MSGTGGAIVTLNLTGAATAQTATDTSGNYTFSGLSNGNYTLTPSLDGYTFSPTSLSPTISNASVTGQNFTAGPPSGHSITGLVTLNGSGLVGVTVTATSVSTYSISGTVSGAVTSGVTMTLSGTASGTTTTVTGGTYTFSGLTNGNYTVTPSNAGYTFSPASLAVPISGASVTGRNFTSSASGGSTYSISGTVMQQTSRGDRPLSGVTVRAGGASATTGSTGAYTISNLANGTYTVTPSYQTNFFTFFPTSTSVTISGANRTGINFTAQSIIIISPAPSAGETHTSEADPSGTTDGSGNYTIPSLPDGTYTVTPSLAGYTFTPASRNVPISGADATGITFTASAAAGPAITSISPASGPTSGGTSVTILGTAFTGATAVTFGSVSATSFTVNSATRITALSPAQAAQTVHVTVTAPSGTSAPGTADQFTYSDVRYTISGTVTGAPSSVTVNLSGAASASTTTSGGAFSFGNLANGTYTVTPVPPGGYTFSPAYQTVAVNNGNISLSNFAATAIPPSTHSISGVVTVDSLGGPVLQGVLVSATGPQSAAYTTGANGAYTLSGLPDGTYTLSASITGYDVSTTDPLSITLNGADKTGPHFIAAETTLPDYPGLPIDPSPALDGRVAFQVMYYYKVTVPSGTTNLTVTMTNLSADMDMYDRIGGLPTPATGGYKQCSATRGTGNETLVEPNPQPGVWFFAAYGYQPGTYKIRGTMTGSGGSTYSIQGQTIVSNTGQPLSGITVQAVSGAAFYTAISDTGGNYSINGLVNGTYTVTPDPDGLTGRVWTPTQKTVAVFNGNATGANFAGFLCTHCLAGVVMAPDGTGIAGVTIVAESQSVVTDANGVYVIDGLAKGAHTVHPSAQDKQRYLFSPGNRTPKVTGTGPVRGVSFTATAKSGAASGADEAAPEEPPAGLAKNGLPPCAPSEAPTTMLAQAQPAAFSVAEVRRQRGGAMGPNARMEETEVYSAEGGNAAVDTGTSARSESLGPLTVRYYYWDHLGTTRMVAPEVPTAANVEIHDYEPFGLELLPFTNVAGNTHQFTGHERDLATGIDYMHYRFYGSNMGRFMKPDNIPGNLANPQSWNKYSYVVGNPVNMNDPTGHAPAWSNDPDELEKQKKKFDSDAAIPGGASGDAENGSGEASQPIPNAFMSKVVSTQVEEEKEEQPPEFVIPYLLFAQAVLTDDPALLAKAATMLMWEGAAAYAGGEALGWVWGQTLRSLGSAELGSSARWLKGTRLPGSFLERMAALRVALAPEEGTTLRYLRMKDPRWPAEAGWNKMTRMFYNDTLELHYVYNPGTAQWDDIKVVAR